MLTTTEAAQDAITPEQKRRLEIVARYNEITGPVREKRNRAIEEFEKGWSEKSVSTFIEAEEKKREAFEQYKADGMSERAAIARAALEAAAALEKVVVERDAAARKLDESLEKPLQWREFLRQELEQHPDDPVLLALSRENSAMDHDAAVEGFLKSPPASTVITDLSIVESENSIDFKRGTTTVFRDVGARLDVVKTDDRDLEAALKVAAQKFDVNKGLLLTGDTAFKVRCAEIAGRLNLPLRNLEPEVLAAWDRGRQQQQGLARSTEPSVERGIAGEVKEPGINRNKGEQMLFLDPQTVIDARWTEAIGKTGVFFASLPSSLLKDNNPMSAQNPPSAVVRLPDDRVEKALQTWRGLDPKLMQAFARFDIREPRGGIEFDDTQKRVFVERGMLKDDGTITPHGIDVILVRDDHVIRSRYDPQLKQVFAKDAQLKTAYEFVREAKDELQSGKQAGLAAEEAEKSKEFSRAKELKGDEREREAERERAAVRARRCEVDLEL
jgi:hypothetical protein